MNLFGGVEQYYVGAGAFESHCIPLGKAEKPRFHCLQVRTFT